MIEEDIRNFNKQFSWEPTPQGPTLCVDNFDKVVVLGMGGSHLGADLLNSYDPKLSLMVHSDYGLPERLDLGDLVIASSYSGNTEEVIDGLNFALEKGFRTAVIASGGKLLEMAKEKAIPYIELPPGLQPRISGGYQVKALAKILGRQDILEELDSLAEGLQPADLEEKGKAVAEKIGNKIPVVYASRNNFALAYTWKIRFNETAKVPAFYNLFPELNHNEMASFLQGPQGPTLRVDNFVFLVLADSEDYPKIKKRMEVFIKLYQDQGLPVRISELFGTGRLYRIFSSVLIADWAAFYMAKQSKADPEQVSLVEEFKKLMK